LPIWRLKSNERAGQVMKVLDLFSGIGGFSLGLEQAGMKTVAFCEIEPFCQAVLKKHWPSIQCHDNIKTLEGKQYAGRIDVICGGFPCQDLSLAGKGAGLSGQRSGLWFEYARIIKEVRPKYAIIENVSALRSRGLEDVLGSLHKIGYDAEWHCIPASYIGAPHRRDRIWIVAYARGSGRNEGDICLEGYDGKQIKKRRTTISPEPGKASVFVAYPASQRYERGESEYKGSEKREAEGFRKDEGLRFAQSCDTSGVRNVISDSMREGLEGQWTLASRIREELQNISDSRRWSIESTVCRVVNGLPNRSHRIKSLGNSIVPQIAEAIGKAIMKGAR
jgi:DNA (cytosine-5)-methyltransferase 1